MNAIIYCLSEKTNIKQIVDKMKTEVELFIKPPDQLDTLIRWGSVALAPHAITYNRAEAIKKASNKALCRQILKETEVPVPKPTERPPCIGRPARHSSGRNFFYCRNRRQVKEAKRKGAVYFSQFYPKTEEYRVHVAHNKILLISRKVGNKDCLIWNKNKNGFEFETIRWKEWPENVIKVALEAIRVIGLDFGAVDIMGKPKQGRFRRYKPVVVAEINTAPRLANYASQRYAEYFDWLFSDCYKAEHLDNYYGYAFIKGR